MYPATPLPLQLDLAPSSPGTLAVLLLLVAACGLCDGLAQGALFGEAALLPPRFTQALVAGTAVSGGQAMSWCAHAGGNKAAVLVEQSSSGVLLPVWGVFCDAMPCSLPRPVRRAGVVVSLLRVCTKATLPDTEQGLRQSANLYFTITALVCAACVVV